MLTTPGFPVPPLRPLPSKATVQASYPNSTSSSFWASIRVCRFHGFLKEHGVDLQYSLEDVEQDIRASDELLTSRRKA
jgi:hypothetical protein